MTWTRLSNLLADVTDVDQLNQSLETGVEVLIVITEVTCSKNGAEKIVSSEALLPQIKIWSYSGRVRVDAKQILTNVLSKSYYAEMNFNLSLVILASSI